MPRLAHVHFGLPLQEDLLQLVNGQIRKMYPVLPAHRKRTAPRLLPLLRGTHPLFGSPALRRRSDRKSRGLRRRRPGRGATRHDHGPVRSRRHRLRQSQRHPRQHDRLGAEIARLQVRQAMADRLAASCRIPHRADALLRPAHAARSGEDQRRQLRSGPERRGRTGAPAQRIGKSARPHQIHGEIILGGQYGRDRGSLSQTDRRPHSSPQ